MPSTPEQQQPAGADTAQAVAGKTVRWGLYLPLVALAVIVAGWSIFWFVARGIVSSGIDRAITSAAVRGDQWICADRRFSGYPFRLEIRCSSVNLTRNASAGVVSLTTGPVVAISHPHTPQHVIIQADGPLRAQLADGRRIDARWDLLEASRRTSSGEIERLSLNVRKPVISLTGQQAGVTTTSMAMLEAHLRRSPGKPASDRARDLSLRFTQLASGDLDALFGDGNPSDVEARISGNHLDLLGQGLTPTMLEAWRLTGSRLLIERLSLRKGIKQFEATGELGLDEEKRPVGRFEPSIANIDQFGGIRLRGGAMDLASALSGRPQPASPDGLRPLPAIDIRGGRISLGPIRLPGTTLQPLY